MIGVCNLDYFNLIELMKPVQTSYMGAPRACFTPETGSVGNVFSVHGYELHLSDTVNTTTLVLGISTLIVAEVFAIGLKMKEEQDLTI